MKGRLSVILNGLIRITAPAPSSAPKSSAANDNASIPAPSAAGGDSNIIAQDSNKPDTKIAYIMPGTLSSSVLIAADLKAASTIAGHFTEFPSDEATVLVQVPFVGDKAPEHVVLHEGGCI